MAKKKLKLKKVGNGDKVLPPIKGTKEQYNSYLDSLNLYKAYQEQLKYNPPQDIKKSYIATHLEPYTAVYDNNVNAQKHFRNASSKEKLNWFKDNPTDYWHNEKQFREDVPEDVPLIDFYKNLTFSTPTKTGLWTTPDLHNSKIAPIDIYFGGNDIGNAAWNPVFKKPVQPIRYDGDNSYGRSNPTIIGTKQKFQKSNQIDVNNPQFAQNPNSSIVTPSNTKTYQALQEQPINIQSSKPGLLQGVKSDLEFNPIPYTKGSYFTRKKQGQEVGDEVEYFDKTTGKKLELGGQINELDMAKNGKKIKKAWAGINMPNSEQDWKNINKQVINSPQIQGYDFNQSQNNQTIWNPLQKGNVSTSEVNGMPNYKQELETPQINAYDFYNPETGDLNQKQEVNKFSQKPKFNVGTFGGNQYFQKANIYRNQAMDNFSKIGQNNQQAPQNQGLVGSKYGSIIKAQDGFNGNNMNNIAGGVSNSLLADINTTKGFLDVFGNLNQNQQVAQWENQQLKSSLYSDMQNTTPYENYGYGFQGRNNALMEHGGEITHGGQLESTPENSTIEVEKVKGNPEILISLNSKNPKVFGVGKRPHKNGGTTIDTSKLDGELGILSSHLIDPTTGLPYSQDAKKNVTTKEEKWKKDNSKYFDDINKSTTDMIISKKVGDAQAKFNQQEQDVMAGIHGIEPIISRLENTPTSKFGGKAGKITLPKAVNGFNYNFQEDKRKLDPLYSKMRQQTTPTGFKYEPPVVDLAGWENIESQLNTAHPDGIPFTDNAQGYYKDKDGNPITDQQQLTNLGYQEQYYDDMLETPEGRQELAKMWQSKGKTLKGKDLKTNTSNLTSLNDKELYDKLNSLRPAYLDSYPKVRKGEKYVNPNPVSPIKLKRKEVRPSDKVDPKNLSVSNTQGDVNGFSRGMGVNFQIPENFQRDPIWSKNLDQSYVVPRYLDVTDELNDINRDANAVLSLATDRTGANIANIGNIYNQARGNKGKAFSNKYQYDKQQDQWAEGTNAQAKMNIDQVNLGQFNRFTDNINQREAAITLQKNMNAEAALSRMEKLNKDNATMDVYDQYYNPSAYSNKPFTFTPSVLQEKEKAKYGKKVKIKPKLKK